MLCKQKDMSHFQYYWLNTSSRMPSSTNDFYGSEAQNDK